MPRLEHHQDTEMPGQNGYAEYVAFNRDLS